MSEKKSSPPGKRQYPPFFERFVPIALGLIVLIIIVIFVIIFAVALGLFPGGA